MTIKEVEEKAGIRKANIRYYEEAGLITPSRDQANNYRIYSEEDVELLKKIRFLRSVDISVEDIRRLKEEEISLGCLLDQHLEKLRREKEKKVVEKEPAACHSPGDGADRLQPGHAGRHVRVSGAGPRRG